MLLNKDMRKAARMHAEMLNSMQQLVQRAEGAERRAQKEAQRRRELQDLLHASEDAGRASLSGAVAIRRTTATL